MSDTAISSSLAEMIENALDATIIVDGHGRIRYVNAALARLTGYGKGELEGQLLNGLLPEDMARQLDQYLKNYAAQEAPSKFLGEVRELSIRHRTGEIVPIELKAIDLGFDHGEQLFGGFMVDLRPRKEIEAQNEALRAMLERQALSDPLTDLPNRRAFDSEAERAIAQAQRDGSPTAVGVADVDLFKRVNDTYGHAVGDEVLRTLSRAMKSAQRRGDLLGRIGGEEFGILLPRTTLDAALIVTERMRTYVQEAKTVLADGRTIQVTISIGVTALRASDTVLDRADEALYRAKQAGRNRVEL